MKRSRIYLVALTLVLTVAACQKPPQVELDAVREALRQATAAEAEKFAADALGDAEAAMQAVDTEIAAQNDKFALMRNYDKAKELIAEAQAKAETAKTTAVEAKAEAKRQAEEALATAKAALGEADMLLQELAACPKPPKGFAADLEALRGQLDGLTSEVAPIEQSLAQEDFEGAESRAGALGERAAAMLDDMKSAKEKIGC